MTKVAPALINSRQTHAGLCHLRILFERRTNRNFADNEVRYGFCELDSVLWRTNATITSIRRTSNTDNKSRTISEFFCSRRFETITHLNCFAFLSAPLPTHIMPLSSMQTIDMPSRAYGVLNSINTISISKTKHFYIFVLLCVQCVSGSIYRRKKIQLHTFSMIDIACYLLANYKLNSESPNGRLLQFPFEKWKWQNGCFYLVMDFYHANYVKFAFARIYIHSPAIYNNRPWRH